MLSLKSFTFNPFAENTFVAYDATGEAIVIDPGMSSRSEQAQLIEFIEQNKLNAKAIVLTHAHIDHVLGCAFLVDTLKLPIVAHELASQTLLMSEKAAMMYGIPYTPSPNPTEFLKQGDNYRVGEVELEIREAPGHAPCHIVLIDHAGKTVIGGDVLFNGSVGRVDLPGGDADTLVNSIRSQLYTLDDDYTVHCGHGESTTIGKEAASNPFVRR